MSTLSVWKFGTAEGATQAETILLDLQTRNLVKVHDAAVVSWPEDRRKPQTKQLNSITGVAALGGAFWGLLFGLLFFVPFLGAAIGAAAGALTGAMSDVGIDDDFVKEVRDRIKPGTSALFLMTSDAVVDKVSEAFAGVHAELIETNLSNEQEVQLREAFAQD